MGYIPTWNLPIHTMETWIMLAPWKTEVAMNDPIKIGGLSQHGETGKKPNGKQKKAWLWVVFVVLFHEWVSEKIIWEVTT